MVAAKVNEMIAMNRVMMFSKSYCPFCDTAKQVLTKHKAEFFAYELDEEEDGSEIQSQLLNLTKQRTVPNIFINGEHVGGCDDLKAKDKSGALAAMLAANE